MKSDASSAPGGRKHGNPTTPLRFAWLTLLLGACASSAVAFAAEVAPRMLLLDAAASGSQLIAVGERGTIAISSDQARTWHKLPPVTTATLTGVSFAADGQHGWAVGHEGVVLVTTNGGQTWARQLEGKQKTATAAAKASAATEGFFTPGLEDSFLDVLALAPERAIAAGAYGLYAVTNDGGRTWTRRRPAEEDYHLNRITRGPTGTLYLAGEHGTLLRSTDEGTKWIRISAPYDGSFYGILPLDAPTLLAYGLRGRIFRSEDDGVTWTAIATPAPALLATAVKCADSRIFVAGQARALFVSRDGGRTFDSPPAPSTAIAELVALPDGALLSFGEAGVVPIATTR